MAKRKSKFKYSDSDTCYVYMNTRYKGWGVVNEQEAKRLIEEKKMIKKGVTWVSTIDPNLMIWRESDNGK